jgi:hypothetical protein
MYAIIMSMWGGYIIMLEEIYLRGVYMGLIAGV